MNHCLNLKIFKMADEDRTFYVGINNPGDLRKELLESSKSAIGILRNYDSINDIRREKIEKIVELKKVFSELKRLSTVLKSKLPSDKIKSIKKEKSVKTKVIQKKPKKTAKIQQLEDELGEIEERLNKMTV